MIEPARPDVSGPGEQSPTFYSLRPHVSYCRVAGRAVFLDVAADRYFCLSPNGDRVFASLVAGEPPAPGDVDILANLAIDGPLRRSPMPATIAACPAIHIPTISLLDTTRRPASLELSATAAAILAAPLRLRMFGLRHSLARVARRKAMIIRPGSHERAQSIAVAFERLRYIATERDNCLTRSLAIANRLVAAGVLPELVIAVKLQPFAAHAWVQVSDRLVNDRYEFVREFTPILVV